MSKQLPERASLEHLKNEAKALKKQSGQRLAEAQLAVAREYGFPSWSKLKKHVEGFPSRRQEFFERIRAGDRKRVEQLLVEDPWLIQSHDPDRFGEVPIASAANRADRLMIDLLLSHGADVDARSDWWAGSFGALDFADEDTSRYLLGKGATLTAHAAARLGLTDELRELLRVNPEAVKERGGDGQFPLHFASTAEIVDILVDAGAELDARDIDHESTAAQWRIENVEVVRRLIERGATSDIFMAVALDDPNLIAKHLAEDPNCLTRKVHEPGNPMIHTGAPGAPIYVYTIGHSSPLQVAANLNRTKAYQYLFEQSPPQHRFLAAAWKGDREAAMSLREHLPKLTKEELAHLPGAARNKLHDTLQLFLELGFPVDVQDHEGMTALHWTGFHGDLAGMKIVLPYHPDLEMKNGYGGTALSTACYGSVHGWYAKTGDYPDCVRLLISSGSIVKPELRGSAAVDAVLAAYRATS
jgi:ankyrin repeat protein